MEGKGRRLAGPAHIDVQGRHLFRVRVQPDEPAHLCLALHIAQCVRIFDDCVRIVVVAELPMPVTVPLLEESVNSL